MHGRQVLYTFGPVVAWYDQVILTWSQPIPAMCGCKWVHLFFCVLFRHIHSYRYLHTFGELPIHSINDHDLCRIILVQNYHYIVFIYRIHYYVCYLQAPWSNESDLARPRKWCLENLGSLGTKKLPLQTSGMSKPFNLESYIENGTSQRCLFVWIVRVCFL